MTEHAHDEYRVPQACTLPTLERPLRAAEFDELFARDVIGVVRESPLRVRLDLRAAPDVAARAADLAVRETGCCSFFVFGLSISDGTVSLTVSSGPAYESVLAALASRAEARVGAVA